MRRTIVFALGVLAITAPVRAEEPRHSLAAINAEVMPTVYVEDRSGHELAGRLVRATDEEVVVASADGEHAIPAANVRRIWRRGDSVKNGFWIGAAIGGVLVALPIAMADEMSVAGRAAAIVTGAGTYGLIGAGIDALHVGRTLIYTAPDSTSSRRLLVAPVVSPAHVAVRVALEF